MQVNPEEFQRRFSELSDDALLEINPDELVEEAHELYYAELQRRGLLEEEEEIEAEEDAQPEPTPDTPPEGELVLAAEFGSAQEAAFGRSLLKSANIPVYAKPDFSGILAATEEDTKIYVPSSFLEQAQELLATPLSDEDLAAQAEAAGEAEEAEVEEAETEEAESEDAINDADQDGGREGESKEHHEG